MPDLTPHAFVLIEPEKQSLRRVTMLFDDAMKELGIFGEADHGSFSPIHVFFAYEYGLVDPKIKSWFSIGGQLLNGNVLFYQTNEEGETVDFDEFLFKHLEITAGQGHRGHIIWLPTIAECERAIEKGIVFRPSCAINGVVLQEWRNGRFDLPLHDLIPFTNTKH